MALSRWVRQVASGDSKRFQDGEFDLNLTYITGRIVGMGFPASGVEGMYRNPIAEVAKFLLDRHGDNFMIWNLSTRTYDYSLFNNQILDYGFPDHHNPPLLLLFTIIKSMHSWLAADLANVAVVHCLAGKGRTGTIIACYLIFCGEIQSPTAALDFYGNKRSHASKGVSRPSQIRYVQYFHDVCFTNQSYKPKTKNLSKIIFSSMPVYQPSIQICQMSDSCAIAQSGVNIEEIVLADSSSIGQPTITEDGSVIYELNALVRGDIVIRCSYITMMLRRESPLLRASFHTAFLDDSNTLSFSKSEIDLASSDDRFSNDFQMILYFTDPPETNVDGLSKSESYWNDETCEQFFATARECRAKVAENIQGPRPQDMKHDSSDHDFVLVDQ